MICHIALRKVKKNDNNWSTKQTKNGKKFSYISYLTKKMHEKLQCHQNIGNLTKLYSFLKVHIKGKTILD